MRSCSARTVIACHVERRPRDRRERRPQSKHPDALSFAMQRQGVLTTPSVPRTKEYRKNSLILHSSNEHSRDASTCSRIAQLSSSGAQHDKVELATSIHGIVGQEKCFSIPEQI